MAARLSNNLRMATVHVFQSYGWHDATDIAQRLKESLVEAGYDVWIDRENLREDDKFFSIALEAALKGSEVVVALLSPHSVRGLSAQDERSSICYNEIRFAEELGRPIVPVRVQKFAGAPPFLLIKYRRIDWLDWDKPDSYRKGVADIIATIDGVLANDRNFDPDIVFQETNFSAQLQVARDSFVGREWLFSRVETWLQGTSPCLQIEGDAGSGKTAFVAELVRRNPGGRMLAYHFCGATPRTLDADAYVKSTAAMIANSIDAYAEQFWGGTLARWLMAADPQTMFLHGVLEPLRRLTMNEPYYIVVDSLDEAIGVTGAQISLPLLLVRSLEEFPPWLKLLVTTRPNERIQRLFRTAETCSLATSLDQQRLDLRQFIEQRLAGSPAATMLEERAAGSFQYAGMVLDALDRGELDAAGLSTLPRRLEQLYFTRAQGRFPDPADYRLPRMVLGMLLVSREPLTLAQLAKLTGLDRDTELPRTLDTLTGFVGPVFGPTGEAAYRILHLSISEWLASPDAGHFQVDTTQSHERLLAHCLDWRTHHESYALKHVIAHLMERGRLSDALAAVQQGLFTERFARLHEPRLDADDARNLTLALVAARDTAGILALARTENIWQRDGVAGALQSARADDLAFIDQVVGALLKVTP